VERVVVTSASRPQPVNSLSLQPAARCPGWEEETTRQNDCNDNVIVFLLRHMTHEAMITNEVFFHPACMRHPGSWVR